MKKIESGSRTTKFLRDTYKQILDAETRAIEIIDGLEPFSFNEFKRQYFGTPVTQQKSFFGTFSNYIEDLKKQGRIGTANSYHCALTSLQSFKKSIHWNDLTPGFLEDYEIFMTSQGRTQNTIGIYLRSLRAIVNLAITKGFITHDFYPFGKKSHGKYQIPSSVNTKKALTREEIELIKNLVAPLGSRKDRAKDFWLFSYYINGANMTDIAHLKWKNIDFNDGMIRFVRKKTERANKGNQVKIAAVITPYAHAVIEKYSVSDRQPENFVFSIIGKEDTPEKVDTKIHDFTTGINKGLKQICKELKIEKTITTYSARHSHATILLQNGASLEQIMDQFKHSSMKVTMNYIDSITDQSRKDLSKML
ncbi:MAG: site-specific integrase [Bacteroidales bacterium]|nr:site-specific integrase [Bacteroidales bacterium]MCF8456558.1 site-specific integrase [Bacteroidales bacterium]